MAETTEKTIAVIIPAAGFGLRMGHRVAKQFMQVKGKTVLAHTVDKIQTWAKQYHHDIVIMVALSSDVELPADVLGVQTCLGGKERADSVANALLEIEKTGNFTWAMVHDAARPMVAVADIEKLYQAIKDDEVGGILAKKVNATVKRVSGDKITATVPREDLWLAQTPQMFRFALLQQSLQGQRAGLTDEASGIENMGLVAKIIEGGRDNVKITTPEDLHYFIQQLQHN